MVEVAKGLHIVDGLQRGSSSRNVTAIVEKAIHLVDCGEPGSSGQIFKYLERIRPEPSEVGSVILTHFDYDHVGSAAEIKKETECTVMAPEFDARVISGERFTNRQLQELFPEYNPAEIEALQRKITEQQIPRVSVDRILHNEEVLGIAGGARVLHAPGHTPGHVVLILPKLSALIAGDTLTVSNGKVGSPSQRYTVSLRQAHQSLKRISEFEFELLLSYHGPPITTGGNKALRDYLNTVG